MKVKKIKLRHRERLRSLKGRSERKGVELRWRLLLWATRERNVRVAESI